MNSTDEAQTSTVRTHRARWAAIGAAVAVAFGGGTLATVSAVQDSGERLTYSAITPCRLVDTRAGDNNVGLREGALQADETISIAARGDQGNCTADDLGTDTAALALNVTALGATELGFLTFWPDGTRPLAASLNPAPGQPPVPNAVTTSLSSTGSFNVYNFTGDVHIVVDVVGRYTDHNHDDRYDTSEEVDAKIAANPGPSGTQGPQGPVGDRGEPGDPAGRRFGPTLIAGRVVGAATFDADSLDAALLADGRPVVVGSAAQNLVTTCGDVTCQFASTTSPAQLNTLSDLRVTVGGNRGMPMAVGTNTANDRITLAECVDPACATSVGTTMSLGKTAVSEPAVALDRNGSAIVSFRSDDDQVLWVNSCDDATCSARSLFALDLGADAGGSSSIAIGADGNPVVAHLTDDRSELRISVCGDARCTASSSASLLALTGETFNSLDLAVLPDGRPIVAHSHSGADETLVTTCSSSACASSSTVEIDLLATETVAVSLAIGSDGLPVIGALTASGGISNLLFVAACSDAACAESLIRRIDIPTAPSFRSPSVLVNGLGQTVVVAPTSSDELVVVDVTRSAFTPTG